jgi:tetratricopeptide (TPR) repeat protein
MMRELATTQRVQALIKLQRYQEAATTARQGLSETPDSASLNILLAIALCESGDYDEAVAAAGRAVALKPENYAAQRTLGWSTYKAGRIDEAKAILNHALSLNPDDVMTHVMLADVLMKTIPRYLPRRAMRKSRVVQEIDHHGAEAIRLDPDRADGYAIRAKASVLEEDAFQASTWAQEALKREPDNPIGHQVLGMSAQLLGDTKAAADHYVTAGRLNPRSSGSTALLKGLRKKGWIGVVVALVLIRVISRLVRDGGGAAQAIGIAVVLAVLAFFWVVWPKWSARRAMSAEAQQVLARDRELRG